DGERAPEHVASAVAGHGRRRSEATHPEDQRHPSDDGGGRRRYGRRPDGSFGSQASEGAAQRNQTDDGEKTRDRTAVQARVADGVQASERFGDDDLDGERRAPEPDRGTDARHELRVEQDPAEERRAAESEHRECRRRTRYTEAHHALDGAAGGAGLTG